MSNCDLDTYLKLCDDVFYKRTYTHLNEISDDVSVLNKYHEQGISPKEAVTLFLNDLCLYG